MGHKKKKHSKNYNKNSNKINITIHNDSKKTKRRRNANNPKSGISSQLGQHVQTNTALYNAKEDQSDLRNQADNYVTHVKKQYNALLENVAAEDRPRQPLQIEPPKENFLHSIMNGIVQKGGINVSFPKVENARQEAEPVLNHRIGLMGVLKRAEVEEERKKAGRPPGASNKPKPEKVSSQIQTRANTEKAVLNTLATATPAASEINVGGDSATDNNVDLNEKAVEVKKPRGRPKKAVVAAADPLLWTEADKARNPMGFQLVQDYRATHKVKDNSV